MNTKQKQIEYCSADSTAPMLQPAAANPAHTSEWTFTGKPETLSERIIQSWFSGVPASDLQRLANAAPELLAACKLALSDIALWHKADDKRVIVLKTAIATAEGQT